MKFKGKFKKPRRKKLLKGYWIAKQKFMNNLEMCQTAEVTKKILIFYFGKGVSGKFKRTRFRENQIRKYYNFVGRIR